MKTSTVVKKSPSIAERQDKNRAAPNYSSPPGSSGGRDVDLNTDLDRRVHTVFIGVFANDVVRDYLVESVENPLAVVLVATLRRTGEHPVLAELGVAGRLQRDRPGQLVGDVLPGVVLKPWVMPLGPGVFRINGVATVAGEGRIRRRDRILVGGVGIVLGHSLRSETT